MPKEPLRSRDRLPGSVGPTDSRVVLLSLTANLVPSILLLIALWYFRISPYLWGIFAILLFFLTLYSVSTIRRRSQYQFHSLHNLLEAIVRGDYSFRGARMLGSTAYNELVSTINAVAQTLQSQRVQSEESRILVEKVVDAIDVAIIAWDQHQTIRMINPAARKLLALESGHVLPETLTFASEMQVGETRVKDLVFDKYRGRYRLHLERFIADGDTHSLLFVTNVSSILRLEERRAWHNLVRVLSHEINNSLTPLKSFSNTIIRQVEKRETDEVLKQEIIQGMEIIGKRADSLAEFLQNYRAMSRLPDPQKRFADLAQIVNNLAKLFPDIELIIWGEPLKIEVDVLQLEQTLINLVKNAIEASGKDAKVELRWQTTDDLVLIKVIDNGCGIQSPENLFTPYYTTKTEGLGIGLVFCQQVIEAHGGFLAIENRIGEQGCEVTISLPKPTLM